MSLFNKKKDVKKEGFSLPPLPRLPELSELPDTQNQIHKLPSFPSNSLGTKFSNDTIKDAVAGRKEDESFADDFFDEDDMRMMQEPSRKPITREIKEGMSGELRETGFGQRKNITEPIFIRIDHFEEALNVFRETKKKMSHIEGMLEEIKKIKEKEESELKTWENEVRFMKEQIEKVDKDIFSKI